MVPIAQFGLIILLSLFLVLHLAILAKIIPYNLVWGGRIKSDKEMYRFEIFSILLNVVFVIVVLVQLNLFAPDVPKTMLHFALWMMTGLFLLNTVGNAMSKNKFEQRVFTPITILLTIFSLILALG